MLDEVENLTETKCKFIDSKLHKEYKFTFGRIYQNSEATDGGRLGYNCFLFASLPAFHEVEVKIFIF